MWGCRLTRKNLNKKNLVDLGADALADLLLDVVKGDAARQRRVRMALAADQGSQDAAADVRRRFASIRRAQSIISGSGQKALARELSGLIAMVGERIAQEDPNMAFDLLWDLLYLAPDIHERTADSNGVIGAVMNEAMEAVECLSPRLACPQEALADRVFDALQDNGYGAFDDAIPTLADALGPAGLTRLKALAEEVQAEPLTEADLARYDFVPDPERRERLARDCRDRTARMILQDVADLQGDVDAWLSRYTAEQLTFHTIAPDAARRLLAAGRAEEALRVVEDALSRDRGANPWFEPPDLDEALFACLEALGREDHLRRALWQRFMRCLCPGAFARYLERLPDFEDIEAEEKARDIVLTHKPVEAALSFCLSRSDLGLAAELVLGRSEEIDGNAYEILTPAADALSHDHPLAAVLVWRSMILFALERARSKRYGHAAHHLTACAAADPAIESYAGHPDHPAFVEALRNAHGRKSAFWARVDASRRA